MGFGTNRRGDGNGQDKGRFMRRKKSEVVITAIGMNVERRRKKRRLNAIESDMSTVFGVCDMWEIV